VHRVEGIGAVDRVDRLVPERRFRRFVCVVAVDRLVRVRWFRDVCSVPLVDHVVAFFEGGPRRDPDRTSVRAGGAAGGGGRGRRPGLGGDADRAASAGGALIGRHGSGPHTRWVTRRRRTTVAAGVLLLALAGAAGGVVLVATTASPGGAAAISYCSASRSVDEYHGRDHAHLVTLLERVQRRAPAEIASVVVAMRQARPTSVTFSAARNAWSHYNTNHCCSCIGAPGAPQLTPTVPPSRTP
jgi:hypothetical protein